MRPSLGCVVEGHGELECYRSLYSKIIESQCGHIPIVNASGFGGIFSNLRDHLTDLHKTHKPCTIIVTVDSIDILNARQANSIDEIYEKLNAIAQDWLAAGASDARLLPLPESIKCILQIKKFESWLISDIGGLKDAKLIVVECEDIEDTQAFEKPSEWLKKNLSCGGSVKNPAIAKKVVAALRPHEMIKRNASFNEFYLECVEAHKRWLQIHA
jgi:Domain of unknown function (DUF4276)